MWRSKEQKKDKEVGKKYEINALKNPKLGEKILIKNV